MANMHGPMLGEIPTMTEHYGPPHREFVRALQLIIVSKDYDVALDRILKRLESASSESEWIDLTIWLTRIHELKADIASAYDAMADAMVSRQDNARMRIRMAELEWKRSRNRGLAENQIQAAIALLPSWDADLFRARLLWARIALEVGDVHSAAEHMLASLPPPSVSSVLLAPLFTQEAVKLARSGEKVASVEYLSRLKNLHLADTGSVVEIENALAQISHISS